MLFGLSKIRGIGVSFANAILKAASLRNTLRVGNLTDSDIDKIEDIITDPAKYGVSAWLMNRRKDLETGRETHFIGADLALRTKADLDFMKDIKTWKGVRHSLGLKVRGQRTRTTGRKGKAVGVKKKAVIAAARAAAAAGAGKEEKK